MRKSKFSESQIVGILKEAESGVPVADLLRPARGATQHPPRCAISSTFQSAPPHGGRHGVRVTVG